MNEKHFSRRLASLRKETGLTQEELADKLHISAQAVSKWENGHSLPETALLPEIARLLDCSLDALFSPGNLVILEALFGDGIAYVNVTKRLNRLVENDGLKVTADAALLGAPEATHGRAAYLTLKYRSASGLCYAAFPEGAAVTVTGADIPAAAADGLTILAGCYGTKAHHYDVMHKLAHYKLFNWECYYADHETFPSDPVNDAAEYLTLVYTNATGIHMATCAEGEDLAYSADRTALLRRVNNGEHYIAGIPALHPFGEGMECSWAAALTAALQAMGVNTTYEEVMGVSGACYRLAFCSPWDYSAVDGLVAYDYATPGYAAYGYTPQTYSRIEKADRTAHRERIMKELRNGMPVLGINLRVAPEWGVIGGYAQDGTLLYGRTKYDKPTVENDPAFMNGRPAFDPALLGPYGYLPVDNWPFLLTYFEGKRKPPAAKENALNSLKVFADCAVKPGHNGYHMGFKAYETWSADLRDEAFYQTCGDESFARRFSVNQFCVLSLWDARRAAHVYLESCKTLFTNDPTEETLAGIVACFQQSATIAGELQTLLDTGEALEGAACRAFWTDTLRHRQASALEQMAALEQEALRLTQKLLVL